jgi:hypothetical protein
MAFGYFTTFQTLDKGLIEQIGPTGFTLTLFNSSSNVSTYNNGFFYRAIFLILGSAFLFLSLYIICLFDLLSLISVPFLVFLFAFLLVFLFKPSIEL